MEGSPSLLCCPKTSAWPPLEARFRRSAFIAIKDGVERNLHAAAAIAALKKSLPHGEFGPFCGERDSLNISKRLPRAFDQARRTTRIRQQGSRLGGDGEAFGWPSARQPKTLSSSITSPNFCRHRFRRHENHVPSIRSSVCASPCCRTAPSSPTCAWGLIARNTGHNHDACPGYVNRGPMRIE